jgi:hypothetical protein
MPVGMVAAAHRHLSYQRRTGCAASERHLLVLGSSWFRYKSP